MDRGALVVSIVTAIILLATAATGTPLWTVPEAGADQAPLGQGSASVSVVSMPDTATLDPGRQGGDVYYLRVPDATVDVSQLRGNPILTYSIDIDGLGYSTSSVNALANTGEGQTSLSISDVALEEDRLTQDRYEGELRLVLRGDGEETVVYSEPITIEVTG
ncbi:hypothetical protein [Salinibaculum salinum]|uniref:hypothetical protein n=1 Tax=Salinibaculum salinum TaxID=3131996 RepID=UPI0030ED443D